MGDFDVELEVQALRGFVEHFSKVIADEPPTPVARNARPTPPFDVTNLDNRITLLLVELQRETDRVEQVRANASTTNQDNKGHIAALEASIADTKKCIFDFKRDVLLSSGGTAALLDDTFSVPLSTLEAYYRSAMATLTVDVEDLESEATNLENKFSHLNLSPSEQASSGLHMIDFDRLRIVNQQSQEQIAEQNAILLDLKASSGRVSRHLSQTQLCLQEAEERRQWLLNEIALRQKQNRDLVRDAEVAKQQRAKAEREQRTLRQRVTDGMSGAAGTLAYLEVVQKEKKLQSIVKNLERKVELTRTGVIGHGGTRRSSAR